MTKLSYGETLAIMLLLQSSLMKVILLKQIFSKIFVILSMFLSL